MRWATAVYALTVIPACLYGIFVHHHSAAMPLVQPLVWAMIGTMLWVRRLHLMAGERLAALDDARAVGPLTDILSGGYRDAAAAARIALRTLLPRLNASDGSALTAGQRATLNRLLRRRGRANLWSAADDNLAVAILKAWEQVGDAEAVEAARWVAEHARSPRLALAAREALPAIEQRASAEHARTTLLRPATGGGEADTLVRPAAATDDDMALLLRPTAGRGGDGEA